jgi:DNA polymerase III delta prime subunit
VFKSESQKALVDEWIKNGIPHVLLEGKPGTGKTSLAYVLLNELQVDPADILFINASRERKPEDLQDKIVGFVSTWPLGEYKYVILDECDSLTPLMQRILRGEMERYADTARFILTCNYANKLIPAIHGRCQTLHFDELDMTEFSVRVGEILVAEGVEFDIEVLQFFIDKAYPDLRKCIGLVQQHSHTGTLAIPTENITADKDYLLDMVNLFKAGKVTEARKLLVNQASPEEYEEIYRFFYENLDIFGDNDDTQNQAILIIAKGLRNHIMTGSLGDPEINLSATIIELANLRQ